MEPEDTVPCSHKPSVPILSQIDAVHAPPPSHFFKIHFNTIFHRCLGLPSGLFPSGLPTKILNAPLLSSISATCPTDLILIDLTKYINTYAKQ